MNPRIEAFRTKFADGAKHLGTTAEQLVSLKLRDNVTSYDEYRELLRSLEYEARTTSEPIQGHFSGNAYIVEHSNTRVIIVEHETGLEILYIAGSIASIVGLVPLVLQVWGRLRDGGHPRHLPRGFRDIEIRRFDGNGRLFEDNIGATGEPFPAPLSVVSTVMLTSAEILDSEIRQLNNAVKSLEQRLAAIEGSARVPPKVDGTKGKSRKTADRKKQRGK